MADISGTNDNDVLTGTPDPDTINGLGGNDLLQGLDGGDTLIGGDGDDRLEGGAGADGALGGAGSDYIDGGADGDYLFGEDGDDTMLGGDGNDRLEGGGGIDGILGGIGADYIDGGALGDFLFGEDGNDTILGGEGDDRMEGGADSDGILGGIGADYISGGTAGDYLFGEDGDDTIVGDEGDDVLDGGEGIDGLAGGIGADRLIGGAGSDYGLGGVGNDFIIGGLGNDVLLGEDDSDTLLGEDGDDRLEGGAGIDGIIGGVGDDYIDGGADGDFLYGEDGGDTILGQDGNDRIEGGVGADGILGGAGVDFIDGGADGDFLYGEDGGDTILGQGGNDRIEGGAGVDGIVGGAGDDYIDGGAEGDFLFGEDGVDTIIGGTGNDVINGGAGADGLVGGSGSDTFAFTAALGTIDFIADFSVSLDAIYLGGSDGEPFAALATGTLAAGSFVIGSQALQADDYLIYNSTTGALSYDADGNGAGAAVQFATLSSGLALTAAKFTVTGLANQAPVVTSGTTASVVENSVSSTVVYAATATDADGDRVTWTLGGTDAGLLTIDAATGEVRLQSTPDYETRTSYSFTVTASDTGPTAATRTVTLSVTDVNDNPSTPVFNETSSPNNSTAAAQVIDRNTLVVATNSDLPNQALPSATINGSISANTDVDFFSITLQAGEQLVLDIDHSAGGLDPVVRVYNPAGTELGYNDDLVSFDPGSVATIASHNTDSYLSFRATTAGVYYFSVESYGDGIETGPGTGTSSGNYSLNVSIGPPATMAQIISEDIDALVSGAEWSTQNLSYGFPTLTSQYPAGIDETDSPSDNFEPFNSTQQAIVTQQLGLISQVTTLVFAIDNANPGATHLRYAMSDEAEVAYAYYPPSNGAPGGLGGSAWFNNTEGDFDNPVLGNYAWMGILHETGHALGLKHGHEFPAISPDRDSLEYTVMTYRSYPGDATSGGYGNETWGFPQSLMMYDIAALQRIYGANYATNAGNSVYTFSSTTGEMSIDAVSQGVPGGNRIFRTIWDGGGTDTYDLSNYTTNMTIDLRPGEWSTFAGGQLANLGGGHIARGNVANALMFEGNPASLIENAIGGSGTDTLIANQAANQLRGNAGADTFKWVTASDAGTASLADTILDFTGGDKIDLSGIDAISGTGADDAFTFLGSGAFTNVAGQLRYDNGHIFGDLDGNGVADFDIVVTSAPALVASDFML